jgi:hypothetical protein
MLESIAVVSTEIQLKRMQDMSWVWLHLTGKSVFGAETLLAVIFQSPFSTPLSTSKGLYLNL